MNGPSCVIGRAAARCLRLPHEEPFRRMFRSCSEVLSVIPPPFASRVLVNPELLGRLAASYFSARILVDCHTRPARRACGTGTAGSTGFTCCTCRAVHTLRLSSQSQCIACRDCPTCSTGSEGIGCFTVDHPLHEATIASLDRGGRAPPSTVRRMSGAAASNVQG